MKPQYSVPYSQAQYNQFHRGARQTHQIHAKIHRVRAVFLLLGRKNYDMRNNCKVNFGDNILLFSQYKEMDIKTQ